MWNDWVWSLRYPICCLYDLGAILLGVANHQLGRLEEGICRDGERVPVGNIENRSGNLNEL